MADELKIERVNPNGSCPEDSITNIKLAVLSDWVPGWDPQLKQSINDTFKGSQDHLATFFVIDDVGNCAASHREFLTDLIEAGAIILVPESDSDRDSARQDPKSFLHQQLVTSVQLDLSVGTGPLRMPDKPEGYQEFEIAFTRLTGEELEDIIERRQPNDDWRYDI